MNIEISLFDDKESLIAVINRVTNTIVRLLWVGALLAPVLMVYSIDAFLSKAFMLCIILFITSIFLIISFLVIWKSSINGKERFSFQVASAETADRESLGFIFLYILPLIRSSIVEINLLILAIILIIFVILTATGYDYHFNPIMRLMGWHFYKVNTKEGVTYTFITKEQLRNTVRDFRAIQLTEYVILDIGDEQ